MLKSFAFLGIVLFVGYKEKLVFDTFWDVNFVIDHNIHLAFLANCDLLSIDFDGWSIFRHIDEGVDVVCLESVECFFLFEFQKNVMS